MLTFARELLQVAPSGAPLPLLSRDWKKRPRIAPLGTVERGVGAGGLFPSPRSREKVVSGLSREPNEGASMAHGLGYAPHRIPALARAMQPLSPHSGRGERGRPKGAGCLTGESEDKITRSLPGRGACGYAFAPLSLVSGVLCSTPYRVFAGLLRGFSLAARLYFKRQG